MIFFFFFLVVFSVGGLVWFRFHYKKLMKYFMEDWNSFKLKYIVLEAMERSIFPLVFGSIHALLIDYLLVQSIVLGLVEICYFMSKMMTLKSHNSKYRFKIVMLALSSLIRMALILTLYLYESEGNPDVINLVHHDLVWSYLICWAA
jgi:hypothetical protein